MIGPAEIAALGYSVAEASPGVVYVEGFGAAKYLVLDDKAALAEFVNPEAHGERQRQFTTGPDELVSPAAARTAQPLPKTASLADVIAAVNALTE